MKDKPLISVVIPTFNRRDRLLEAIDSVLQQVGHSIEIIIVDDGSTDGTKNAIDKLDNKVRYFYQSNQGQSVARNLGIEKSKGEYIAFLDSDDLWLAGKLNRDLAVFKLSDEIECVVGNSQYIKVNGREIIKHPSELDSKQIFSQTRHCRYFDWSFLQWEKGSICPTSAMIIKRHSLDKLGKLCFNPLLRFAEDWDFELRLYMSCKVIFYPEILVNGRIFDDGTRLHYTCPGKAIPVQEKQIRLQNKMNILSRYTKQFASIVDAKTRFELELSSLSVDLA